MLMDVFMNLFPVYLSFCCRQCLLSASGLEVPIACSLKEDSVKEIHCFQDMASCLLFKEIIWTVG